MNKKRFKVPAFTVSMILTLATYTDNKAEDTSFQKFDEVAYFSDDNYNIYDENFSNYVLTRSGGSGAQEIIDFLTGDQIQIQNILVKNLYKYTNPANIRPLLDLPAYQSTYPFGIPCGVTAGFIPFYTQTRKQYFTANSPHLCSYLAFSDFGDLEDIASSSGVELNNFDLPQILSLFNTIKLEDRRVGAIFSMGKTHNCCSLGLELPFYYIERNIFLNQSERDAIQNNPFFAQLSGGCAPSRDVEDFVKQHVVGDMLGFGDTRLSAYWKKEADNTTLSGGLELTLPSAAYVMDHMIAHHRCRSPMQPVLDILGLIDTADTNDNTALTDAVTNFSVCALDRFLRICTDTKLGSETVTIAPRVDLIHAVKNCLSLAHMARFTCFLPYRGIRFFRECKRPSDFDRDWSNPDESDANLQFLSDRLVNMIYPQMQHVKIDTRFSFEYSVAMQVFLRDTAVELGYDLWLLSREKLNFCSCPNNDLPLDLHRAESPNALQQKLFGRVMWEHASRCGRLWHIGLVGDWTCSSYGIGKDWSLGLTANVLW